MQEKLRVKDIMNNKLIAMRPEYHVSQAAHILLEHNISSAPVLETKNGQTELVGFVTEADCIRALGEEEYFHQNEEATVREIMSDFVVSVSADADLFSLSEKMSHSGLRHLPVLDKDRVVGMVSRRDCLHALLQNLKEIDKDILKKKSPFDIDDIPSRYIVINSRQ